MKKTYFGKRNALVPRGWRATGAVTLVVALVIVLLRVFAPGFFVTLATPLWNISSSVAGVFRDAGAVIKSPVALQAKLDAVGAENASLQAENAALRAEVSDFIRLLGVRTEPVSGILAGVLARPPESPYDSLIIDAGTDVGVTYSAEVFGPGGIPVGRVASVMRSSARITLFSTSGTATEAWVGERRLPLTLTGAGGGALTASVSKDAGVAEGDAVYVSGPGAVPFGTVVRIDTDASSPSATLRVQASVNPYSLTWVTIARTEP